MRLLFAIFFFFTTKGFEPNQVRFHAFTPSASGWNIEKWNIDESSNQSFTVKETIDSYGRVIQLEFLKNGELINKPPCYLANKVKYEYVENKAIETLYHFGDELLATDCEMHYKTIYHLDREYNIFKLERFAKYNFSGLTETEIKDLKNSAPEKVTISDTSGVNLEIAYYYHSFAKMNGQYPVNRQYIFKNDYYYGDEPERSSILKALRRK